MRNRAPAIKDAKKAEHYQRKVSQIAEFLKQGTKKQGPSGNEQKSNITDPESAKMSSLVHNIEKIAHQGGWV